VINSLKVAFFLAVKTTVRGNPWVFLLTIAMLMLVFLNLVFAPSLIGGVVDTVNDKIIHTLSGNIIAQSSGQDRLIGNVTGLVSKIESLDNVAGACGRNDLLADLFYQGERTSAAVYAIDPMRDRNVFRLPDYVIEGSYLEAEDTGQILLGVQIAGNDRKGLEMYATSLKHVHAGDRVQVSFTGGIQREYTVKGIFQVELIQTDITAYITDTDLAAMNPLMADRASSIHISVDDDAELQPIIDDIAGLRSGLKFQTWEDVAGVLRSMTDTLDQIIAILQFIALVVAGITIFIITYVDLVNKRRQIGIQRAIGITSSSIIVSYVFRALFYAFLGTLASALVFVYVVVPVEARHPFHFPFGEVLLVVDAGYLATSALILWGVSIVSAFIPAWQTIRIRIIDAIWSS